MPDLHRSISLPALASLSCPERARAGAIQTFEALTSPKPDTLHPKRRSRRIGNLKGGAAEIRAHPWFKGFDWEALINRFVGWCQVFGGMEKRGE